MSRNKFTSSERMFVCERNVQLEKRKPKEWNGAKDKVKYPPSAACRATVVRAASLESGPCVVIYPPLV